MSEFSTPVLRYFYLALVEYIPLLKSLRASSKNKEQQESLDQRIEMYEDIKKNLSSKGMGRGDPNLFQEGEPYEIEFQLSKSLIIELSSLVSRFYTDKQRRYEKLKNKEYKTTADKTEMTMLKKLLPPLHVQLHNQTLLGMNASKEQFQFPEEKMALEEVSQPASDHSPIFPQALIENLPKDVGVLCDEFNFCRKENKPHAALLLLRRILPLSIVRKFQSLNEESKIRKDDGEFLDTKALLGKVESKISEKRAYKEVSDYKILVDSSQHSYSLKIEMSDASGVAIKLRVFLDELFS